MWRRRRRRRRRRREEAGGGGRRREEFKVRIRRIVAPCLRAMETVEIRSPQLRATILTHGASLAQLHVADRHGVFGDVVLGFTTQAGWQCAANPCMGCIIGRVAGRTAPRLLVDGVEHLLPGCDGGGGGIKPSTNLHGGLRVNRDTWEIQHREPDAVTLKCICVGQISGFPGVLK
jgi:aldose 1-epimerase